MTYKVLDLFCGAGGAAMGLHRAWPDAEITGVDIKPQPHYPFTFVLGDAMTFPLEGYDFIWASPPCQRYSDITQHKTAHLHPDYLPSVQLMLRKVGVPYAIENVMGAPFDWSFILCGWMFGLPMHRHRQFETSRFIMAGSCPGKHKTMRENLNPFRATNRAQNGLSGTTDRRYALAMGIDWMAGQEISEAIPPAYAEFIARQIRQPGND